MRVVSGLAKPLESEMGCTAVGGANISISESEIAARTCFGIGNTEHHSKIFPIIAFVYLSTNGYVASIAYRYRIEEASKPSEYSLELVLFAVGGLETFTR